MKQSKFYATRDLALATYIAYNGVKFAKPYDKTTRSWIFQDPDKCKKLDLELRNGESSVEVIKYESVRRNLLGMVKDGKGEEYEETRVERTADHSSTE